MNEIVMFFSDDDGELIDKTVWHLVDPGNPMGNASLCTAEFFGGGESAVEFEQKRGKVTCPDCIGKIKKYKAIRL